MTKKCLTLLIILVGLSVASCSSPPETEDTTANPPIPEATSKPVPEDNTEQEVVLKERENVAGLEPSTNPQTYTKGLSRGVADPFESLNTTPVVNVLDDNNNQTQPSSSTSEPLPPPPEEGASPPEGQTETTPDIDPASVLAESVVVSGIVEVGNTIQVILKAPKENFSRYVQIGQYISNGEVLVKRIEDIGGRTPIVILEQSGIEIRKPLGVNPANEPSTQASL